MGKYKIDQIQSQADLDSLIKSIREESSNNYSDASQRTQRKIENLENQIAEMAKEMNEMEQDFAEQMKEIEAEFAEYDQALAEAYEANDTYEMADRLNELGIDPRFHDILIKNGLNSDMEAEELEEAIGEFLERFPEAGLDADSPLRNNNDDEVDPAAAEETNEQEDFDTTKTMQ